MNETTSQPKPSGSIVLEYQLTEADVRRYRISGRPGDCWQCLRERKGSMTVLAVLGLFLIGLTYLVLGARSGTLAMVTAVGVLTALAWSRRAIADRQVCRMAHAMGFPNDVRLAVSPEGIAKEPGEDPDDPGRAFEWSEVVEVARVDSLTIFRLRPAGGVLIVPDRAFPDPEARVKLVESVQGWREATVH